MRAKENPTNMVRVTLEEVRNARMTPEQQARFAAMTDDDIVYDDDSPDTSNWPDEAWTRPGVAERKAPASMNGKQPAAQANSAGKRKAHAR